MNLEREYIELVENILINNSILVTSKLSSSDETEQLWNTGKTSLYEYLKYAIGKNAISVKAMDISSMFLDKDAIYQAVINFTVFVALFSSKIYQHSTAPLSTTFRQLINLV